jgi:phage-related minor tail protein
MFDGDKQQITDAFASPDDLIGNRPQGNLFQQYVDQAQDANKQISSIFETTYSGLTDVIVSTLSGGKDTWRDFALSAVQDMLKIEVETQILGPLMKMLAPATGGMGFGVGGVFGELMSGIGSGGAMSTASLIAHQGGTASFLGGLLGDVKSFFADGGIMTSHGSIPLHRYSNGGVADSPQLAMYGEGRGPEAYVPLPDGRSIPVAMKGGGGGGNVFHTQVNITGDGTTTGDSVKRASSMQRAITYAIQQELIRQKRDGGILSNSALA